MAVSRNCFIKSYIAIICCKISVYYFVYIVSIPIFKTKFLLTNYLRTPDKNCHLIATWGVVTPHLRINPFSNQVVETDAGR